MGEYFHLGIPWMEWYGLLQENFFLPGNLTYIGIDTLKMEGLLWSISLFLYVWLFCDGGKYEYKGRLNGSAKWLSPQTFRKKYGNQKGQERIYSSHVRVSMDTRKTRRNNNALVIGGSGVGKSRFFVKPNILNMCGSYLITDPSGELLRDTGTVLEKHGYTVRVFQLIDPKKSHGFNPFAYIRKDQDVFRLVTNLIQNTNGEKKGGSDPFWENAESLLLSSLLFYVYYEYPLEKRNFRSVLELLQKVQVEENTVCEYETLMDELREKAPFYGRHPAVLQYEKFAVGAEKTMQSVLIGLHARLVFLQEESILSLLDQDELLLGELGTGVGGNEKRPVALFCVIPDADTTYNFLAGLLYSVAFQELYYVADFVCQGRLPIHVNLLMDEFANISLPRNFVSLLSTMRKREISAAIIIQNLAQIKAMYDKEWESLVGNCDSLLFLGGNEQGTQEMLSKLMGEMSVQKISKGTQTKGNGGISYNADEVKRELLKPEEIRMLPNDMCLFLFRGEQPIKDRKYRLEGHPRYKESADGKGKPYSFQKEKDKESITREKRRQKLEQLSAIDLISTIDLEEEQIEEIKHMYETCQSEEKIREKLLSWI